MRSLICGAALYGAAIAAFSPSGHAHVGSSETVNNRYYKLAPMADRVRLVYTIFYGRQPSGALRRSIDSDHDGLLSDVEVAAYANTLQSEVFSSTSAHLDTKEIPIRWQPVDMGMGRATTSGGAFSADFVGTICLENKSIGSEHALVFRDHLRLDSPGESELRIDPAPGIRIIESRIGGREIGAGGHKWQGGPGPAEQGHTLRFFVEQDDSAGLDRSCKPTRPGTSSRVLLYAGAAAVLLLGGVVVFWRRRKRW